MDYLNDSIEMLKQLDPHSIKLCNEVISCMLLKQNYKKNADAATQGKVEIDMKIVDNSAVADTSMSRLEGYLNSLFIFFKHINYDKEWLEQINSYLTIARGHLDKVVKSGKVAKPIYREDLENAVKYMNKIYLYLDSKGKNVDRVDYVTLDFAYNKLIEIVYRR